MHGREAEELAQLLQEIQRLLRQRICAFLEQQGIPFAWALMLWKLGEEPGLTISELGRRLQQSKGYVSVQVEQMEREGLVQKLGDPDDQRVLRLHLTDRAVAWQAALQQDYRQFLADLLAAVPVPELQDMIAALKRLRDTLPEQADRARQAVSKGESL